VAERVRVRDITAQEGDRLLRIVGRSSGSVVTWRRAPGDSCPCPHWGYVMAGRMTVRYSDREEVIEPGDAFYLPPGHVPAAVAGTELVMFSPQDELAAVEAAMRELMQLKMQKGTDRRISEVTAKSIEYPAEQLELAGVGWPWRPTALFALTVTAAIGVALLPAAGARRNRR
jgi:quercetin dioxygenase-like cupin family protein